MFQTNNNSYRLNYFQFSRQNLKYNAGVLIFSLNVNEKNSILFEQRLALHRDAHSKVKSCEE